MNFNELMQKMRDIDQPKVQHEGMWDTVTNAAKSAAQGLQTAKTAVANTTLGDVGNAVKNYSLPGMAASAVKGAANAIKGAVAPAGAAGKPAMAPVKPMNAFGGPAQAPEAEFGDLPPQSTAGAGRGSINPPMAGQAPAKPAAPPAPAKPPVAAKPAVPVSGASIAGVENAFAEEYDNVDVEECGMPGMNNMPSGMMGTPKQQDNVTMNVSMNGSGAGGIRDLLNVLKDIQGGPEVEPHRDQDAEHDVLVGDSYDNAPNEVTLDMDAVIPTGNDIHSKGREAEKVNGGGNPFNVDESSGQDDWRPAYRAALTMAAKDPKFKEVLVPLYKEYETYVTALIKSNRNNPNARQQIDLKFKQDLEKLIKTNAGYGSQPTPMKEALVARLSKHYQLIKES
jgi:hypothetical protein